MHARVALPFGGLLGVMRLVSQPVRGEVTERVHQTGRLQVLLAVRFDGLDRVGETRRVLRRRKLTLHIGQGPLAVRRRVGGRAASATCIRSTALLVLFRWIRCLRRFRRLVGGGRLGRGLVRVAAGMGDGDAPEEPGDQQAEEHAADRALEDSLERAARTSHGRGIAFGGGPSI